jgi:hypothetical protein
MHPVGTACHVVHSGARNVEALFFMLGWAWYAFHKKARQDTLCRTSIFALGGICRSCSAFQSFRGVNHRFTIVHARVGQVRIPEKVRRDMLRELVLFHPVGSMAHVVHLGAPGSQNIKALFSKFGSDYFGFDEKRIKTCYAELVFLHLVGPASHVVHSGASEA